METAWWVPAIRVALALVVGVVIPAVGMRMLAGTLETHAPRVSNYRGVRVPAGLGLVWVLWSVGAALVLAVAEVVTFSETTAAAREFGIPLFTFSALVVRFMPVPLVLGAVLLGFVDDSFGDSSAKGFRGHLAAMAKGRLSSGALKLVGIGSLSLWASATLVRWRQTYYGEVGAPGMSDEIVALLLGTAVIALSANLVNLFDLRPGRSLKVYAVWVVGLLVAAAVSPGARWLGFGAVESQEVAFRAISLGALALLLLGPAAVVWAADLKERGMLGDAGANAMGALAGYVTASLLETTGLAIAAGILLALNLLSERVSFSAVIERLPLLHRLDMLGRIPLAEAASSDGTPEKPDER